MAGNNRTEDISFEFTYSNSPVILISITGIASDVLLLIGFVKDPLNFFRN